MKILLFALCLVCGEFCAAQQHKTENLIIVKAYKPKVLYISFDETDDFAHAGLYDQYLKSSHTEDAMINDLWNIVQSMPEYKGKIQL